MDVLLTLILSCSLHTDDRLVQALAYRLSVGNQFFVGDLSTLNTYDSAKTAAEAIKIANAIKVSGGRPAVGLMAIPLDWAPRFGRTPEELFDGCTNISIGTAMLSDFNRLCAAGAARQRPGPSHTRTRSARPNPALRVCILRRLETEMNIQGIVQHVLPVVSRLDAAPPDRHGDSPAARAPLLPEDTATPDGARDWSSPRLFLSSPTAAISQTPMLAPAAPYASPARVEAGRPVASRTAPRAVAPAERRVAAPK